MTGQRVSDEQLAEWRHAVGYFYEAGVPLGTSEAVLNLMDGDGGLLVALEMLRAAREENRQLRERIDVALALHTRVTATPNTVLNITSEVAYCRECEEIEWPCKTLLALGGDSSD